MHLIASGSPGHKSLGLYSIRLLQRPLHPRRNPRLLRPTAAGHVEHLDVVLANKGRQSLTGALVAAALA